MSPTPWGCAGRSRRPRASPVGPVGVDRRGVSLPVPGSETRRRTPRSRWRSSNPIGRPDPGRFPMNPGDQVDARPPRSISAARATASCPIAFLTLMFRCRNISVMATVPEAAARTGLPDRRIRALVADGALPATKVNAGYLLSVQTGRTPSDWWSRPTCSHRAILGRPSPARPCSTPCPMMRGGCACERHDRDVSADRDHFDAHRHRHGDRRAEGGKHRRGARPRDVRPEEPGAAGSGHGRRPDSPAPAPDRRQRDCEHGVTAGRCRAPAQEPATVPRAPRSGRAARARSTAERDLLPCSSSSTRSPSPGQPWAATCRPDGQARGSRSICSSRDGSTSSRRLPSRPRGYQRSSSREHSRPSPGPNASRSGSPTAAPGRFGDPTCSAP